MLWKCFHNRKNWLFCWTEIGAERVGVIQSLLLTCRLQRVDPYTYLVDALQRISVHPASRVVELTPREWKTRFAQNPMRSYLALVRRNGESVVELLNRLDVALDKALAEEIFIDEINR